MNRVIAITGAASYFGQVLITSLRQLPWVERIIALDAHPGYSDDRCIVYNFEGDEVSLVRAICAEHAVDTLILADFWSPSQQQQSSAHHLLSSVEASQAILRAAYELGMEQILLFSSVATYGYRPTKITTYAENHRLWPNTVYGMQTLATEAYMRTLALRYFATRSVVIRATTVVGPLGRSRSALAGYLKQPFFILSNNGQARTQVLHEHDLATLVSTIIERKEAGTFNASPDDWVTWADVARLSQKRAVPVPRFVLRLATYFQQRIPELRHFNNDALLAMSESLVASNNHAYFTLGWNPRYSCLDALQQFFSTTVEEHPRTPPPPIEKRSQWHDRSARRLP